MLVMKIRIMFSQLKKVVSLFICRILFFLCSHFASTTRGRPPLLMISWNIYNFSAPILGLHNVDLRRPCPHSNGHIEQNQGKHTLWKLKEIQTPMAWPLCSPCWGRRRRRKSPRRRRNTSLAQEDFLTLISSCLTILSPSLEHDEQSVSNLSRKIKSRMQRKFLGPCLLECNQVVPSNWF